MGAYGKDEGFSAHDEARKKRVSRARIKLGIVEDGF